MKTEKISQGVKALHVSNHSYENGETLISYSNNTKHREHSNVCQFMREGNAFTSCKNHIDNTERGGIVTTYNIISLVSGHHFCKITYLHLA